MIVRANQPVLAILTSHWLSLLGAGVVSTAAISWILALPSQLRGSVSNPYIGILLFVVLPVVFVMGLALIPAGVYLSRRKVQKELAEVTVDRETSVRRLVTFLAITTAFNVVIGSQLTYRAVAHMESAQFCGQSCHVMTPEFTAWQASAHSRVLCVECHVGEGASGWLESKVSGTRQLAAVILNNYPRPVPSAIVSNRLVNSKATCEHCHSPEHSTDVKLRVIPSYKDDEKNTASFTVLQMKIGRPGGSGIHGAHLAPGARIRYAATSPNRETIPLIEYRNERTGVVRIYRTQGAKADEQPVSYEMQCVDCHSRPAHSFEMPERTVNRLLAAGEISSSLPFGKKTAMAALRGDYADQGQARRQITERFRSYYSGSYPTLFAQMKADVERAGDAVAAVYGRNVFPDMRVTWGTYVNNMGHTDFPGCFRCHDESHAAADKKTISQDCTSCHDMLAVDETSPEILKTLNLTERTGEIAKK